MSMGHKVSWTVSLLRGSRSRSENIEPAKKDRRTKPSRFYGAPGAVPSAPAGVNRGRLTGMSRFYGAPGAVPRR